MISFNYFIACVALTLVVQVAVWFQLNGQFFSPWFKNNNFLLALMGIPISYGYIYITQLGYQAFGGLLWPNRFVGFALGMMIFAVLNSVFINEGISLKSAVSLVLAGILVAIQVLWK
jgi:hypothetical protein